jgi:Flp pilus assembly protein TadG
MRRITRLTGAAGRLRADDDAGITVVLVALLLTVMLMFVAFAIDGGQAYSSHRESQNASDSAAMTGVKVLKQVKFLPTCGGGALIDCTAYTAASLDAEIETTAWGSGADRTAGVECWLLDGNTPPNRTSTELCRANVAPSSATILASSGVEVRATQTRATTFAGVAGVRKLQASTTAKAQALKFVGGTGSPFVTCGIRATRPATAPGSELDWSYDLFTPNANGTYSVANGAANRFYSVQGSQNPGCGSASNTFKGKSDGNTITDVPSWSGITSGNGFENRVQLSVAGIKPCPPGVDTFDGCGMLIPIADGSGGSGASTVMHVVAWAAFQVWGSGNTYTFAGSPSDPLGSSCGKPISVGGSMKYCGKFLGAATVTGGTGSGAAEIGQPAVVKIVA